MKTFLSQKLVLFFCLLALSLPTLASAAEYLNNDPNFLLYYRGKDAQGTVVSYLKLNSLKVEEYKPPLYVISADILIGHEDTLQTKSTPLHMTWQFNYEQQSIALWNYKELCWKPIPKEAPTNSPLSLVEYYRLLRKGGEAAWEKAYTQPFYKAEKK